METIFTLELEVEYTKKTGISFQENIDAQIMTEAVTDNHNMIHAIFYQNLKKNKQK